MHTDETSYEKGRALEELVAYLFEAKGYRVTRGVWLQGRSGVRHQIDVLADYVAPLHTSRIIIECKSYDRPVDKDTVMKLIHVVQDLGADKGILVTTSYFTPDAISTAKGYNVDLWDGAKLNSLLEELGYMQGQRSEAPYAGVLYVAPVISIEEACEIADKSLRSLIWGRKGWIESYSIVFYPFYELDVPDARLYEVKGLLSPRVEERIVSITVLADPIVAEVCSFSPTYGITGVAKLPILTEEEAYVYRLLLTRGQMTVHAVSSLLGCSASKARRLLQGLVAKGLAEVMSYKRYVFYQLKAKPPAPSQLSAISNVVRCFERAPTSGVRLAPSLSVDDIAKSVEIMWGGSVRDYRVVYYPYFACKVEVGGGKKYIEAVDLVTGKHNKRAGRILTSLYSTLPF